MRAVNVSAGGEFLAVTGSENQSKKLAGARLCAGSTAATMTVRETDGSGRILYALAALTGTADGVELPCDFIGKINVTIAGTGAVGHVFEP
jgi:hypothetical protein